MRLTCTKIAINADTELNADTKLIFPFVLLVISISVSYTHLDVYKRQPLMSILDISIFLIVLDLFKINSSN